MTDRNFSKKKACDKTACPLINTLLNEKLITDTNISTNDLMCAIKSLNIFDSTLLFILENGVIKQFMNPDNIINHITDINKQEHDISLSRLDLFQGDCVSFNKKHFQKLKNKSVDKKYLTIENFADFRKDLILYSHKKNPHFKYGIKELFASCAEDALLCILFSDKSGNVRIDWLEYFFVHAKFPINLDYKIKRISFIELLHVSITQLFRVLPSV